MCKRDTDPFGDLVVEAWRMTTPDQRGMCVEDYTHGRGTYHLKVAVLLYLDPEALLLAAMLDAEHPSVCNPNGRPKDTHFGRLRDKMKAWKPVDNTQKPVDNSLNSVEKITKNCGILVERPVDGIASYPQVWLEHLK